MAFVSKICSWLYDNISWLYGNISWFCLRSASSLDSNGKSSVIVSTREHSRRVYWLKKQNMTSTLMVFKKKINITKQLEWWNSLPHYSFNFSRFLVYLAE